MKNKLCQLHLSNKINCKITGTMLPLFNYNIYFIFFILNSIFRVNNNKQHNKKLYIKTKVTFLNSATLNCSTFFLFFNIKSTSSGRPQQYKNMLWVPFYLQFLEK